MTKLLSRLLRRPARFPAIRPDSDFYVIGDIHGRVDLLTRLTSTLQSGIPVVFVGDYVDRGEDSAKVLRHLAHSDRWHCLMGNHEAMLLDFLDAPETAGTIWLRNGGLQTLASFGIAGLRETSGASELSSARDALADAMGGDLIRWLRGLPLTYRSGNVLVAHAGPDPACPVDGQPEGNYLWGHPDFLQNRREDGIWVVHGHWIVNQARCGDGRVAIDTGAYATGRLTAARISPGDVSFGST